MKIAKITKTVLEITVLHEEGKDPCAMELHRLAYEVEEGGMMGIVRRVSSEPVPPEKVADEEMDMGGDGTFFAGCAMPQYLVHYDTKDGPAPNPFLCWADDEDHAREQCENAEPGCTVVLVELR